MQKLERSLSLRKGGVGGLSVQDNPSLMNGMFNIFLCPMNYVKKKAKGV